MPIAWIHVGISEKMSIAPMSVHSGPVALIGAANVIGSVLSAIYVAVQLAPTMQLLTSKSAMCRGESAAEQQEGRYSNPAERRAPEQSRKHGVVFYGRLLAEVVQTKYDTRGKNPAEPHQSSADTAGASVSKSAVEPT